MAKSKKDTFVNRALQRITMSAANTLTFQQVNFAVGIFQGVAIVLHRIRYYVGRSAPIEAIAATDTYTFGLTVSSQIADIAMTHVEVIDSIEVRGVVGGTPATLIQDRAPVITDFTTLPMGGMLVAANPIYLGVFSAGLSTALVVDVDILFTFIELSDSDYIELIQSRVQANL